MSSMTRRLLRSMPKSSTGVARSPSETAVTAFLNWSMEARSVAITAALSVVSSSLRGSTPAGGRGGLAAGGSRGPERRGGAVVARGHVHQPLAEAAHPLGGPPAVLLGRHRLGELEQVRGRPVVVGDEVG